MADQPNPENFTVARGDAQLDGEAIGTGRAVLLLHGATATRRYVVHGSRSLERAGFRVVSFDARGHGESTGPHEPDAYTYDAFAQDAIAVLDAVEAENAVIVGHSLGAAVAARLALVAPARVRALVLVTPAHRGRPAAAESQARWESLADGLEHGGVEGFLSAYGTPAVPTKQQAIMLKVVSQRLSRHRDHAALAACLRGVFRGAAFEGMDALASIDVPTLAVASRDEMDPDHPEAIARDYAAAIPGAESIIEEAGESPLAWRGGSLSKAIAAFLDAHDATP